MKIDHVVVVGGGIAGMAMAAVLERIGCEVTLLERAPELGEVGAGVSVWRNAIRPMMRLGIGSALFANANPVHDHRVYDRDGTLIKALDYVSVANETGGPGFVVHRAELHQAFWSQLTEKTSIRTGAKVVNIELGSPTRLTLEDGSFVHADMVIGADGLHSVMRSVVVGATAPSYSGETCFRGIAPMHEGPTNQGCEVLGAGLRASYYPLSAGRTYWGVVMRAAEGAHVPVEKRRDFLLARVQGWPRGVERLVAATAPQAILQHDLFDRPPTRPWHRGNVVLIGDAAHPMTPHMGQGANMAIEDAVVLGRSIAQATSVSEAGERFERERFARVRELTLLSRRWGRFLAGGNRVWSSRLRSSFYRWLPESRFMAGLQRQFEFDCGSLPVAGESPDPERSRRPDTRRERQATRSADLDA